MSRVIADISMSLDGYVTATGVDLQNGLGLGGEPIHAWVGVAAAIDAARTTAQDNDVVVMGGANVVDQSLAARLVEELRIHLSPVIVGGGTRLFDLVGRTTLVQRQVLESPRATHVTYDVVGD